MKRSLFGIRDFTLCILRPTLFLLFFLTLLGFSYFSAHGYDDDAPGKWWKDPKIVKELELSDSQVNQIEGIFSSRKGQIVELDSSLSKKEAELKDTIKNPNSSREAILRLTNEVEDIKGNMRRVKIDMFLQIRDVLTPKQRSKLQEIKTKHGKPYRR